MEKITDFEQTAWAYPPTEEQGEGYLWLEDLYGPGVIEWYGGQNEFTLTVLEENAPAADGFIDRLMEHYGYDVQKPEESKKYGEHFFWMTQPPDRVWPVLMAADNLHESARTLVDPGLFSRSEIASIGFWEPSPDGNFVAYSISTANEMDTIVVRAVGNQSTSDRTLPDEIPRVFAPLLTWLPDESGFYVTKSADPDQFPEETQANYRKLYFHELNTDAASDQLILGQDRPIEETVESLELSADGRFLIIQVAHEDSNEILLHDTQNKTTRSLTEGNEALFNPHIAGNTLFMHTNKDDNMCRVVKADLDNLPETIDEWEEVIPASPDLLDRLMVTESLVVAVYSVDVAQQVRVFRHDGTFIDSPPLPEFCTVMGIEKARDASGNPDNDEVHITYETFVTPATTYRYNPTKGMYELYHQVETAYDPNDFVIRREWATSPDRTKVPFFVVHHKDTKPNGTTPTILRGYGCHGVPETLQYLPGWIGFMQDGGVHVTANIRGGSEYGQAWHADGKLGNKQHTFDDFIAVAEQLKLLGYTDREHLAIHGYSNGGLMVGAVMAQQPDLCKAVLCQVPVLDMARYHRLGMGRRWISEFGDPENPEDFAKLMSWSPYHNINRNDDYPAVLFTTAPADGRVHPSHAGKMTALMQALDGPNPVLLLSMDGGHIEARRSIPEHVRYQAWKLAFLAWQLGLYEGAQEANA